MSWSGISATSLTASASMKDRSRGRSEARSTVPASSRCTVARGQEVEEHEVFGGEDADHRATERAGDRTVEGPRGESGGSGLHEIHHVEPGTAAAFREGDPADKQAPEARAVERQGRAGRRWRSGPRRRQLR